MEGIRFPVARLRGCAWLGLTSELGPAGVLVKQSEGRTAAGGPEPWPACFLLSHLGGLLPLQLPLLSLLQWGIRY